MTPSDNCLGVVKRFEGCQLRAYKDVAGVLTIGWGHTGADVTPGLVWTQDQADRQLEADVSQAARYVTDSVHVPLTQGQFDALVDFVYNLGPYALRSSTLLRLLNAGHYAEVPECLYRMDEDGRQAGWIFADGQVEPGLVRRRQAEIALWKS